MTLFFHLFKVQSSAKSANGSGLLSMRQSFKYFESYSDSMKHLEDHFFLVAILMRKRM